MRTAASGPTAVGGGSQPAARLVAAVIFFACCLANAAYGALPRQEDVFKSIQDNVKSDPSDHSVLALLALGGGVLILLALFSRRSTKQATPKALNHSGKLLKEISKKVPLRPAEVKQLRLLADAANAKASSAGDSIRNPLVMVLCPSVLARSLQAKPPKMDKKVVAGLALKMGLVHKPGVAKPKAPAKT